MSGDQGARPAEEPKPKSGIELAREALAQARADAAKRQSVPGQRRRKKSGDTPRDPTRGGGPQLFGAGIKKLLAERGWEEKAAVGGVFGNWAAVVGPELAEHTRPGAFTDGELTIDCDSPAWAQQVRLLAGQLVRRLNEELGDNTVTRVKVVGPQAQRRPGQWRVR
ncbi:DciA family protein [Actinocorallia aurea]